MICMHQIQVYFFKKIIDSIFTKFFRLLENQFASKPHELLCMVTFSLMAVSELGFQGFAPPITTVF